MTSVLLIVLGSILLYLAASGKMARILREWTRR